jgi:hypothetical protein
VPPGSWTGFTLIADSARLVVVLLWPVAGRRLAGSAPP